jgi:hypothetical protein
MPGDFLDSNILSMLSPTTRAPRRPRRCLSAAARSDVSSSVKPISPIRLRYFGIAALAGRTHRPTGCGLSTRNLRNPIPLNRASDGWGIAKRQITFMKRVFNELGFRQCLINGARTIMDFDPAEIAYLPTTGVRRTHQTELVAASELTLEGYGCLVDTPKTFPIEIVRWPAQGWRPIDENSGDQGGVAEGLIEFWWQGETRYARNHAVGDSYVFGWSTGRKRRQPQGCRDRGSRR